MSAYLIDFISAAGTEVNARTAKYSPGNRRRRVFTIQLSVDVPDGYTCRLLPAADRRCSQIMRAARTVTASLPT
jgi:hypothetical protein